MESKDNSLRNIEEKVLSFLKANPDGVSEDKLTSAIPFQSDLIAASLNKLIYSNRINAIDTSEGVIFKYRSEKEALKFRDLEKLDIAIYEVIMQSGSNGISTVEIKNKLKIDNTSIVNKALNKLSKKYLIKSLKVLNTRNKKVWIGIDIEPSKEITGGVWFNEQELDDDLVKVFSEKCIQYIEKQKSVGRKEILLFAKSTKLGEKASDMKDDEIQKLLNILVFDGKIEPIFPINIDSKFLGNKYSLLLDKGHPDLDLVKYRRIKEYHGNNIFQYLPCFVCPSFSECKYNNVLNSVDCIYNKFLFNNIEE
jgi:DNA-directed RNA polymerase III subunit RPC6